LPQLGRWAAQLIHGKERSPQGHLLTKKHVIEEDQEWRLGQAYIGMLGILYLIFLFLYVGLFHHDLGYWVGRKHHLGRWSDLPLDLKILIPPLFPIHLIAILSFGRAIVVWNGIGSRTELEEKDIADQMPPPRRTSPSPWPATRDARPADTSPQETGRA
jgi:hypothetical protein